MNLTKDESRILAVALSLAKYDLVIERSNSREIMNALEKLESKLTTAGNDARRKGRTSQNDFNDCLKRYTYKNHL